MIDGALRAVPRRRVIAVWRQLTALGAVTEDNAQMQCSMFTRKLSVAKVGRLRLCSS